MDNPIDLINQVAEFNDINEFMLPLDNKDISELNPQAKIYILKKLKALLDV